MVCITIYLRTRKRKKRRVFVSSDIPYEEYKKLTGEDAAVQEYLNEYDEVHRFFELTQSIVCQSVDNYLERNFKNLFVNFGCTGGQHRSVFFAQKTAKALHEKYPNIKVVLNHIVQHKNYTYETE